MEFEKLTRRCRNVIHSQWCNLRFGCRPVAETKANNEPNSNIKMPFDGFQHDAYRHTHRGIIMSFTWFSCD